MIREARLGARMEIVCGQLHPKRSAARPRGAGVGTVETWAVVVERGYARDVPNWMRRRSAKSVLSLHHTCGGMGRGDGSRMTGILGWLGLGEMKAGEDGLNQMMKICDLRR